jgi:hypothetical protein
VLKGNLVETETGMQGSEEGRVEFGRKRVEEAKVEESGQRSRRRGGEGERRSKGGFGDGRNRRHWLAGEEKTKAGSGGRWLDEKESRN